MACLGRLCCPHRGNNWKLHRAVLKDDVALAQAALDGGADKNYLDEARHTQSARRQPCGVRCERTLTPLRCAGQATTAALERLAWHSGRDAPAAGAWSRCARRGPGATERHARRGTERTPASVAHACARAGQNGSATGGVCALTIAQQRGRPPVWWLYAAPFRCRLPPCLLCRPQRGAAGGAAGVRAAAAEQRRLRRRPRRAWPRRR